MGTILVSVGLCLVGAAALQLLLDKVEPLLQVLMEPSSREGIINQRRYSKYRLSSVQGSVTIESSFRNVPTGRYVSGRLVRLYDFTNRWDFAKFETVFLKIRTLVHHPIMTEPPEPRPSPANW